MNFDWKEAPSNNKTNEASTLSLNLMVLDEIQIEIESKANEREEKKENRIKGAIVEMIAYTMQLEKECF